MDFFVPKPSEEGVAKMRQLYFTKCGKEVSDAEAADALGRVMRYLYLMNYPCFDTPSTPENPMTTPR